MTARRETRKETRERLDSLLVRRGLAASREKAQALILAGRVFIGEERVDKAGTAVSATALLTVEGPDHPYVSRGGVKLAAALDAWGISVKGKICLDVGASTGGFTDCLLHAEAASVYAVDVGSGQFDARLRADPRVRLFEKLNARFLEPPLFPASPELVTVDVSFISLSLVLPAVARVLSPKGEVIALVKPQFEVGRGKVGKGGVVRDRRLHRDVLLTIAQRAGECGLHLQGVMVSPLTGPKGNTEFLMHLTAVGPARDAEGCIAVLFPDGEGG